MKEIKKINNTIAYLLMGVAVIFIIYTLCTHNKMPNYLTFVLASASNLLALTCGIVYTVKGSSKEAYMWLKWFEVFAGISLLASVAREASIGSSPIAIVATTLSFGLLCVLCYAENLGKKRSYLIGASLIIIKAIVIIISLASKIRFAKVVNMASQLLILIILVLLLTQKYKDKESRGSK